MIPDEKTARQDRYRAHMTEDFGIQSIGTTSGVDPQFKAVNALEYMAYQMGQINRNLARLVDHLEKQAK